MILTRKTFTNPWLIILIPTFHEGEKEGEEDAEFSFGADESGEKSGEKETGEDQEPGDDDVMTIDDDEDEPEK